MPQPTFTKHKVVLFILGVVVSWIGKDCRHRQKKVKNEQIKQISIEFLLE